MRRTSKLLALLLALTLAAGACGDDDSADGEPGASDAEASLVIYSGRNEELVGPLIDRFEEESGFEVDVRYGDTAEMAAQILEEGDNSPADVFFGQDAGALGALAAEGRLRPLSQTQLDLVPAGLRDDDGDWVGVSGRSRVVAYNTDALTDADLPASILDFTDPKWDGKIGWAPTNGSFQAFVTALRVLQGEDAARAWLEGIKANGATSYDNNIAIIEALAAGEIEVGFVNHYYLYQYLADDPAYPVANKVYGGGDIGALVNVAGVGVLTTAEHDDEASAFVDFLLSEEAQRYFADETYEIPLASGVAPHEGVPTLDQLQPPALDLNDLDDLSGTLALLAEVGLV
ncbi:MAG TPA: iron ABC transporter substrate-binding protein [Acidimicrobiales bacterium]|nr:iron ABC transporter substrate-binding protein [Acidimicrobiales bacterium]